MIKLFDYHRSSAGYRVRIALNLKRVAYERIDLKLLDDRQREPENLARNPQGFVPTLEIDGASLPQSLAIIEYLDTRFPEPRLIPAEPLARARAMAQALLIACDIHPLNNLRVLRRLEHDGVEQGARDDWYRHWVREGFSALEKMAGEGPFLGGAAPGIADAGLVPQMFNARRFDLDLAAFPKLLRADEAACALPEIAAAHPDRVKDAA